MRFAVGIVAFWATLAVLVEFESTADLAVAIGWSAAIGMTFANGEKALDEIQRLVAE